MSGTQIPPGYKFGLRFLLYMHPLSNSTMMSALTVHCSWEEATVRERTAHPPSYAEAKQMKLQALHVPNAVSGLAYGAAKYTPYTCIHPTRTVTIKQTQYFTTYCLRNCSSPHRMHPFSI